MSEENENKEVLVDITPHDDIEAAYNAFYMMDSIDTKLLGTERAKKVNATKRMCIDIVYEQIKYLYQMCESSNEVKDE